LVNDARAFALGQLRHGAAATASDAVFVTLGTGVGGAVASDGALRLGSGARGGELGHMPISPDGGRRCGCGATGCLETIAGGKALAEMGADLVRAGTASALAARVDDKAEAVTAGDVVAAADDDPTCAELVADAGRALGLALAALATTLAPEVVVVGGGLAAALPKLAPHLDDAFTSHARLVPKPRVLPARFGNLAGAVGAAAWARCPPAATVRPVP
jgi:glucokinase